MKRKSMFVFILIVAFSLIFNFNFIDGRVLAEDTIELRALLYTTEPPATLHDELIEQFEEENPDIKINVRRVPFGDLYRETAISIAADEPPDVLYVDGPMTNHYAHHGILMPLDNYFTDDELEDFIPSSLEEGSYDGRFYSIPERQSAVVLFYNKDYVEEAGITPPDSLEDAWTWPEFLDVLQEVTIRDEDENVEKWGLTQVTKHTLYSDMTIIRSAAPSRDHPTYKALSDDGSTVQGYLDTPEAIEAFQFLQDLHQEYKVTPVEQTPDMFETGESVFHMSPGHTAGRLIDEFEDLNWGITPLPYFETPITHTGSFHFGVSMATEHPDEAVKFAKFMTNTESQKYFHEGTKQEPARHSVFELIDTYDDLPMSISYESMIEWGQTRPQTPAFREYENIFNRALFDINTGADVEEVVDELVEDIDGYLIRYQR